MFQFKILCDLLDALLSRAESFEVVKSVSNVAEK